MVTWNPDKKCFNPPDEDLELPEDFAPQQDIELESDDSPVVWDGDQDAPKINARKMTEARKHLVRAWVATRDHRNLESAMCQVIMALDWLVQSITPPDYTGSYSEMLRQVREEAFNEGLRVGLGQHD